MPLLYTLGIVLGSLLLMFSIWANITALMPVAIIVFALSAIQGLRLAERGARRADR